MALMFPRLARNFARNGYFPTDEVTLERALQLRSVTVNWNSVAFQPRIFCRSMCTPRANWSV